LQVNYAAGEPVWSEREGDDLFYIIKEGSALLKDASSGAVLSKLGPGAHFGQQSLLGPGTHLTTCICSAFDADGCASMTAWTHLLGLKHHRS
jgi:CRP-like cAMP-binding protein